MASIKLRNSFTLGDYSRPYIVAEINTSHFGKLEVAKELIDKAKESGCDCVKFQSWTTDTLYSISYYTENPIAKRFVKKFSFSEDELLGLANYCKEVGIAFASTPYSTSEVDFLINKCDVPYIKIASMDINNLVFLKHIARTKAPIVLSTGMADYDEVVRAVETIEEAGNTNISILHCVSIYPAENDSNRLFNIVGLKDLFPDYPIGFSDHSIGTELAIGAVALGACMIEKHFTLDNKNIGMDNQMATEPSEMKMLVDGCHNVQSALGGKDRILLPEEVDQRKVMRRSVVANKDLSSGSILSMDDFDFKRPGTGFSPETAESLVGKKLNNDISFDQLLTESDIL